MLNTKLLGLVRYPDEAVNGYDDRIPYEEVIEAQKILLSTAKGADRAGILETLRELERRWKERQYKLEKKSA